MNKLNKFSDHWKEISEVWKNLTSPARPSNGELAIYKKCIKIKNENNLNALIMGATPELRDLLSKNEQVSNIVIVDINMEMILAMTELIKNDTSKEIWIKSNWIDPPLKENHFDLILGDFTFENMPFENHYIYFNNVKSWLKEGGSYIGRIANFREKFLSLSIDNIENNFKNKKIDNELLSLFWELAVFHTGEMKTREVKVSDFFDKLEIYKKDIGINYANSAIKSILDINENVFPKGKSWFMWGDSDFKNFIKEVGLKIVSEECSKDINMPDNLNDMAPIFVLQK